MDGKQTQPAGKAGQGEERNATKTWILLMTVLLAGGLTLTLAGKGHSGSWSHEGGAMFIHQEGAERFDVSDLADGETRVFGTGAKQVSATRTGDIVTLSREENDDAQN